MPRPSPIKSPQRIQPGNAVKTPRARSTAESGGPSSRCSRGEAPNRTCPPSSCPSGSRLRAVSRNPTQPATAMGCRASVLPSGNGPTARSGRMDMPSGYPRSNASRSGGQVPCWNHCSDASNSVQCGVCGSTGTTVDHRSPRISTGTVATKPAMGPAAPMSMSARRVRGSERSRITAPSVPITESNGAGMKKGQVASTPCLRARKKCPISCASMMKRSERANPSPWCSISSREGSGSWVSLSALPARNAEANVRRKRRMLSRGGRSAPSVPGPGAGGGSSVSSAAGTGSTGQPIPCFAEQIQPESRLSLQAAGKCTMLPRLGPLPEQREGGGEVRVQIAGVHATGQRRSPALHRALELAAFRQRHPQALERVGVVLPLRERPLEPGDRLAVPALPRERGPHPLERGRPLGLQCERSGDSPLGGLRLALREIDLREREMGLEGRGIDRQQVLASLPRCRERPLSAEGEVEREREQPLLRVGEARSEEHTSELQSRLHLVCRLLLEKK